MAQHCPNLLEVAENLSCQQLLKNPILDIAARFWDEERYEAFRVLYDSMRVVDDLIDNRKSDGNIPEHEKQQLVVLVNKWFDGISKEKTMDSAQEKLIGTIRKFKISMMPLKSFSESMIYDINHEGFKTYDDFLRYSEGAAVAPASMFMHLCAVFKENKSYRQPGFDIIEAARPAALFAYHVHIIRDFQKDQNDNLNYFADDILNENGLSVRTMREMANGVEINEGFRRLMKRYHDAIRHYRDSTRKIIDMISLHLEPRYRLSLEIVFNLYSQIFERIDVNNGNFTTQELNPSPGEIMERINLVISSFEH